jgi:phosphoglycolate phosphatase
MTDDRPSVSAVIFDLDGTLVQTRQASWDVFRKVNDRFDLGVTTPEAFYGLFRDNVFRALEELCGDAKQAREVKHEFLALLRSEYLPPLVPAMADVVRELSVRLTLCVLSSNAMEVVRRILVANDLAYCFAHVFTADVEPSKARAIERFLSDPGYSCGRRGVPAYDEGASARHPHQRETIMVTDTIGDVREAREAGIRSLGVTWGMHSEQELLEAGAEFVAIWPQEILAYLAAPASATGTASDGPARRTRRRKSKPEVPAGGATDGTVPELGAADSAAAMDAADTANGSPPSRRPVVTRG